MIDSRDQVFDASEATSSDGLLRDETKPTFYVIEPGGVGWRVVPMEAFSMCQPDSYLGMLMGGVMIDDPMDVEIRGHGLIDALEELKKLLVRMACLALSKG